MRAALLTLVVAGCAGPVDSDPVPAAPAVGKTLWLAPGPDDGTVDLHFVRAAETPGPRLMELRLALAGPRFLEAGPLDAIERADKRLVVQDEGETLRLVVLTTSNLNPIDSGPLVRLRFSGAGTVDLVGSPSIFAPPAANAGLQLGEPIAVGSD